MERARKSGSSGQTGKASIMSGCGWSGGSERGRGGGVKMEVPPAKGVS